MSGDHNMYQKDKSYLDFECPRCGHCCKTDLAKVGEVGVWGDDEPVAWIHNFIEGGISIGKKPTDLNRHPDRWTALYKDPTPCKTCQALAMAVMNDQTYHEKVIPKREWVGLTDEEFKFIASKYSLPTQTGMEYFKDELEAKLKERNHG